MPQILLTRLRHHFGAAVFATIFAGAFCAEALFAVDTKPVPSHASTPASTNTQIAGLMGAIRAKAIALENSSGMRSGFRSFTAAYKIAPESIRYSDYILVRLLY